MNYSTLIHSSLVNPAQPKLKENEQDPIDTITLDVPLLTRLLELAREDIKDDAELHNVLTRILALKNQGTLGMNHYDQIIGKSAAIDKDTAELESIRKLAGI